MPDPTIDDIVNSHFHDLGLPSPSDDTDLRDAGLSSLQIVDLILLIEMQLGTEIPPAAVTPENFHSVATIKKMLEDFAGIPAENSRGW